VLRKYHQVHQQASITAKSTASTTHQITRDHPGGGAEYLLCAPLSSQSPGPAAEEGGTARVLFNPPVSLNVMLE